MSTHREPPPRSESGLPLALAITDVRVAFGGTVALDGASLAVRPGTVHALLGENGAGKTTLMRVAFGLVAPDAGTMHRAGVPYAPRTPREAIAAGLGMVFQHFSLVPAMTVAENIALGGSGAFDPQREARRVRALAERTGLAIDPTLRIAEASIGMQQRSEILKALSRDASVLMLDEPTAVLAPQDAAELLQWVRRFARDGRAVVLVTHRLQDALAVSDDITVLRRGRTVLADAAERLDEGALARAMVGEASIQVDVPRVAADADRTKPVALRARGVSAIDATGRTRVDDVDLDVHAGEVLGVAAIEGEGQHELLRLLAGRLRPSRGSLERPPVVAFVPEDRHRDAVVLDATLTENFALRELGTRRGRMPWSALAAQTTTAIDAFDVRAPGADVAMRTLSGGNQQKFVLARELADRPPALVIENPTRGLDIRAADAVRAAIRRAADDGTAVVVHSGDLDELLLMADRVVVMTRGRLLPVTRDRDTIARAMIGTAPSARTA
ncbi:MAG: ATP-binding cassette domain-containing protein [Gemmatimonadaceae bacterium]|jgi:simple sugar transport system ATP-binding protein|nr:ATP-binding cassette domain-containing protein [Gemmatimonadaceae bacterium]